MDPMTTTPPDASAHNDRALRVLSVLAQGKSAMTAAELAEATGLVKSTLYRQIAVLRRWGFVMESDGRYSPGPVSVQLASGFDGNSGLVMAARADMRALAQQSHESVALVTLVNDRVVCLEMIDSEQSLRCSFDRGRSVPA
ncbi:MAG TPA: helix-turn-helix domain-containing protein, partial [Variovorax sp.]|nr:helix-turn-helix domain-containing protein [Variovorax sp.]